MSDHSQQNSNGRQDTLAIHTRKITDSCRDKDCIEDLRVYLTQSSQRILDSSASAKVRCADLIYTYIDVEPVAFDRNHYCVDVTFYYRVLADAVTESNRPAALSGLCVFSKRAVLCGEESKAHIFTSQTRLNGPDGASVSSANLPTAVVEALDPMVLSSKVRQMCDHHCNDHHCKDTTVIQIPEAVSAAFDEQLVLTGENRQLLATLGQFSIIRLERDAQIVVPVLDYSIPSKECCDTPGCAEDPCEMFSRIPFPTQQFASNGCDGGNCRNELTYSGGCDCNYTTT